MERERLPIFQERLLLARRRRALSQGELAEKAHVFKTDISKYERGQSQPTLPRLHRLATVLGVSADYLLGLREEMTHA
jgi:transcriptional regulator with XRE-family HTH domain